MTRTIINTQTNLVSVDPDFVAPSFIEPQTADSVRSERDALLLASDWTQVMDAPVDKTAWAAYRQELRDITVQSGFPHSVVWPDPPIYK